MFVTVKNIDADSLRYLRCMVKRRCKITINFLSCSQDFEKIFKAINSGSLEAINGINGVKALKVAA